MSKNRKIGISALAIGLLLFLVSGFYCVSQIKKIAAAYIYGYPLVLMEQTRIDMSGESESIQASNHFTHVQILPDHEFRNVIRPNNDTFYSVAWIDLSQSPLILSVPDTKGRYYVMPFMDAWTNVFASVGKRVTGTKPGNYVLIGPEWNGAIPSDLKQITAPTDMVWLIGRIQSNGSDDIPLATALQEQFSLTPLDKWSGEFILDNANSHTIRAEVQGNASNNPSATVDSLSAKDFFEQLSRLLVRQAPSKLDSAALQNLNTIGIIPGQTFDFKSLNNFKQFLFDKAVTITRSKTKEAINERSNTENGWVVFRDTLGNFGANYNVRAAAAMVGLGVLPPQEAAYPNTYIDSSGQDLNGVNNYRIHFETGETPPVNAFWSLSLYNDEGFFTDNLIKRYSIGDRNDLNYNQDGSLDIFIQNSAPVGKKSNWLPAPKESFNLTMRLYMPKESFLNGKWALPEVVNYSK